MFCARGDKLVGANCNILFVSSLNNLMYILQVRGSMPFLWEQIVDLTYKPSFDVVRVEEAVSSHSFLYSILFYHQGTGIIILYALQCSIGLSFLRPNLPRVFVLQARVLERHFHDLQKKYGAVVAIDLVNSVSIALLHSLHYVVSRKTTTIFGCCSCAPA